MTLTKLCFLLKKRLCKKLITKSNDVESGANQLVKKTKLFASQKKKTKLFASQKKKNKVFFILLQVFFISFFHVHFLLSFLKSIITALLLVLCFLLIFLVPGFFLVQVQACLAQLV